MESTLQQTKQTWCLTSIATIRLIWDRDGVGGGGEKGVHLLHCQHQNDFCVKMGSDESNVNVTLIVIDKFKSQGSVHKPQTF